MKKIKPPKIGINTFNPTNGNRVRRGVPVGPSFAVGQLVTVSTTDGDVNGIVGPGNIWYPLGP